jgi:hypothetical protein
MFYASLDGKHQHQFSRDLSINLGIHIGTIHKPVHRYRELIGDFFDSTFKTP